MTSKVASIAAGNVRRQAIDLLVDAAFVTAAFLSIAFLSIAFLTTAFLTMV